MMNQTGTLPAAMTAVEVLSERVTQLVGGLVSTETPIEGSAWSLREVAAHLIRVTTLCSEMVGGTASPVAELTPAALARFNAQRLADIAETEPAALARSMAAVIEEFVQAAAHSVEGTPIVFHGGIRLNLGQLTCVLAGEYVLHGYDIARTVRAPWPIDPAHAALVLAGYRPLKPHIVNPETSRGHTAAYRLELGAAGTLTARFTNGAVDLQLDPVSGAKPDQVDCVIKVDPLAFLLISSGRLSQWAAITLGLMASTGPRAELGLGFYGLFRYPWASGQQELIHRRVLGPEKTQRNLQGGNGT